MEKEKRREMMLRRRKLFPKHMKIKDSLVHAVQQGERIYIDLNTKSTKVVSQRLSWIGRRRSSCRFLRRAGCRTR